MTGPLRSVLGTILVLVVVVRHASANIAFEHYDIRRPDDADVPVGAFLHELGKLGYIAEPRDVMDHLGNQVTHPGIANPKLTARQLLSELGTAHAQWTRAQDFRTLVPALATIVAKAFDNPALVVTDQTIRSTLQKVLLDLALGYGKLAHQLESGKANDPTVDVTIKQLRRSSEETMAEWIRTFSGEVITKNGNSPEAESLYLRVQDQNNKLGRGVLSVTIDDPDVQFYVNETIRLRRQAIPDLLPGRYRVLAMAPNDDARLFIVDVLPNQTTRLDIRWSISSNLVTTTSSVALVFASTKHPEPSELACELARTAGHAHGGVVLVGTDVIDLQWHLAASQYDIKTCQLARSGHVTLRKPVSARSAQALARFIAEGTLDPEVVVTSNVDLSVFQTIMNSAPPSVSADRQDAPSSPRPTWLPWATAATSAAFLATGGYAVQASDATCGWGHPKCILGHAAIDVGVVLGGVSLYYWRGASRDKLPAKWLVIGGAAAVVVGAGLYAVDQDPGGDSRYYRDTAPAGVAVGALGLASVGVGVWSWMHNAGVSSIPTLSASSSHTTMGWAGSF